MSGRYLDRARWDELGIVVRQQCRAREVEADFRLVCPVERLCATESEYEVKSGEVRRAASMYCNA